MRRPARACGCRWPTKLLSCRFRTRTCRPSRAGSTRARRPDPRRASEELEGDAVLVPARKVRRQPMNHRQAIVHTVGAGFDDALLQPEVGPRELDLQASQRLADALTEQGRVAAALQDERFPTGADEPGDVE